MTINFLLWHVRPFLVRLLFVLQPHFPHLKHRNCGTEMCLMSCITHCEIPSIPCPSGKLLIILQNQGGKCYLPCEAFPDNPIWCPQEETGHSQFSIPTASRYDPGHIYQTLLLTPHVILIMNAAENLSYQKQSLNNCQLGLSHS